MRGYSGIQLSLSACVHFVRNNEIDDGIDAIIADAQRQSILIGYVDYDEVKVSTNLASAIGKTLGAPHAPYGEKKRHLQLLDDLIALSTKESGLVIIVDNSQNLIQENIREMFDIIEAFLIQFDKWFEKNKPCHLCFQIEKNIYLKELLKINYGRNYKF